MKFISENEHEDILIRQLREFLSEAKTGQIELNVNSGRIESCNIKQYLRVRQNLTATQKLA